MLFSVLEFLMWLQPEATGGVDAAPAAAGDAAAQGGSTDGCVMQAGMFAVMMLLFYFMMIRPQQKKQREHEDMLKSIRRGTIVRTNGGIRGEIVSVDDNEVVLMIADKVKINILRSAITGVVGSEADAKDKGGAEGKNAPSDKSTATRAG